MIIEMRVNGQHLLNLVNFISLWHSFEYVKGKKKISSNDEISISFYDTFKGFAVPLLFSRNTANLTVQSIHIPIWELPCSTKGL